MSETTGLWMLLGVAVLLLATGLPAWTVLLGVAAAFSALGMATGVISMAVLTALPPRLIGLLEQDLLQALPLYVLLGAMLNRLPLARILFNTGTHALQRTGAGPQLMSLLLGLLLAPINGSVGASVTMLSRTVQSRLAAARVPASASAALICAGGTFGVVIPPSLVLILLGDAMLRAHTEAVNATHQAARIINTQDLFRGALPPALLFCALCMAAAWWMSRRGKPVADQADAAPTTADRLTAAATVLFLVGLLAGVALGYFYAVEGAAAGGVALALYGFATRTLSRKVMADVLRDTMALSGALFALLIAATMFTLVLRLFGTDRWIADALLALPGGPAAVLAAVLLVLALSALVLDAFEIIFVVIPIVMPPLLMRQPDAVWMSVIALLMLQASFLLPPLGYAVLLIRHDMAGVLSMRALARALAPYVFAQAVVLGCVLAFPQMTHVFSPPESAPQENAGSTEDGWEMLRRQQEEAQGAQGSQGTPGEGNAVPSFSLPPPEGEAR
ncbi:TRAP transporter large permease subunit [Noviherbaspirillum galbum]|uniref:TRAP transporter large permease subunit n=1 Tax=Noviherbaspirillum galbum TaxID=2709383 RepID=A0A6B3STN2_9BURK|nr:TRAP transporter large permease subunit [Noviherbaspirillum galbum]NEX64360.1 TRAP transporter large permease subunit [Noviherbaspirillum galbum]